MMTFAEIRDLPTSARGNIHSGGIHESCFRSYAIVDKLLDILIEADSPESRLLVELIRDMRSEKHRVLVFEGTHSHIEDWLPPGMKS